MFCQSSQEVVVKRGWLRYNHLKARQHLEDLLSKMAHSRGCGQERLSALPVHFMELLEWLLDMTSGFLPVVERGRTEQGRSHDSFNQVSEVTRCFCHILHLSFVANSLKLQPTLLRRRLQVPPFGQKKVKESCGLLQGHHVFFNWNKQSHISVSGLGP